MIPFFKKFWLWLFPRNENEWVRDQEDIFFLMTRFGMPLEMVRGMDRKRRRTMIELFLHMQEHKS